MMSSMTPEEKAALEAKQAADKVIADKAVADAAKDDDPSEDDDASKTSKSDDEESLQLKADLEKERKAREKAEKALAKNAFESRKGKRDQQGDEATGDDGVDETVDDEAPLTQKQLTAALARERQATRRETLAAEAVRIAQDMSTNETMQQLVLEKWKNRTFPADLSLQDQIEECFLAANKKRILGENKELKRALLGKRGINKDASGTQQDEAQSTKGPKGVPVADAREFARLGFIWNSTATRYEKKLANGKLLVKDLRTKKTSII